MIEAHVIQWYSSRQPLIKLHEVINGWIRANPERRVLWSNQSESLEGMSNLHVTVTLYHAPLEGCQ
jgi:hypothetical protein